MRVSFTGVMRAGKNFPAGVTPKNSGMLRRLLSEQIDKVAHALLPPKPKEDTVATLAELASRSTASSVGLVPDNLTS